jgi:hypothetical protein
VKRSGRRGSEARPEDKAHRAKIAALLKAWIANRMFVVVDGLDDKREKRAVVEVGEWAND